MALKTSGLTRGQVRNTTGQRLARPAAQGIADTDFTGPTLWIGIGLKFQDSGRLPLGAHRSRQTGDPGLPSDRDHTACPARPGPRRLQFQQGF
jgi:hypothetical protein